MSSAEYKYTGPTQLFINGHWVDAISKKTFPALNPATKQVIAQVAEADAADVDAAVKAARKAWQSWRNVPPGKRCELLWKLSELFEKHRDELATIEAVNNGKPKAVAFAADLALCIECLRYYAGWADKLQGKTIPVNGDAFVYTVHEPVGVVGAIIPWNFPLLMFIWKVAPCLATGNVMVLKTAEQTPLSASVATRLIHEAGFPPGVFNLVHGYGPTCGAGISSHMDIDKIAFTGSTEVGRIIQIAAAKSNLKNVTLELGGKSPLIVAEDADLDKAVEIAHTGLFFNMGQCCCASSRIYVHEKVHDEFVRRSVEKAKASVVGDPLDPKSQHGPQVDKEQFDKILGYISHGKETGAKLECGGGSIGDKGFFIQPTVFSNVVDDMKIAQEEIFGPVMSILKYTDLDEVIRRCNKTTYGLAAGIITKDLTRALDFAHNVRAGTVWVNQYDHFSAAAPFGGYKHSGIGRELGEYGLRQYTEVKCVNIALPRHHAPIEQ